MTNAPHADLLETLIAISYQLDDARVCPLPLEYAKASIADALETFSLQTGESESDARVTALELCGLETADTALSEAIVKTVQL